MSIQQAINQGLSTAGIAARLSPGYEQKQELHQLSKQQETLTKQKDISIEQIKKNAANEEAKTHWEEMNKRNEQLAKVAEKSFALNPTQEAYDAMIQSSQKAQSMKKLQSLIYRQEDANITAASKIEAQKQ